MMWKKILMSCSVCMMVAMMAVSAFGEIEIQVYKPVETTPGAEFGSDKAVAQDIQEYFLEHTGVKFIPHSLPMDQYAQTLNTVFASGDKMDLFFALQFVRYGYVKNKIYTPITQEMLDQYGPNIKKAWTQETWDYLKDADGNYVGIPRNG
ncbi:MAG: extracellular solute-binding protein, partial [bacterium]|nr:extracellular solute-binding protein [bacterium]